MAVGMEIFNGRITVRRTTEGGRDAYKFTLLPYDYRIVEFDDRKWSIQCRQHDQPFSDWLPEIEAPFIKDFGSYREPKGYWAGPYPTHVEACLAVFNSELEALLSIS